MVEGETYAPLPPRRPLGHTGRRTTKGGNKRRRLRARLRTLLDEEAASDEEDEIDDDEARRSSSCAMCQSPTASDSVIEISVVRVKLGDRCRRRRLG